MAGTNPVHTGPCCRCRPSLGGAVQAAAIAIRVVREDADRRVHEAGVTAAVAEAENQTLWALRRHNEAEIRRLKAALQASNDKLAEALAINAKQALHANGVKP